MSWHLFVVPGEKFEGVAVIVTIPLGCLKAGDIAFKPALPGWKQDAIQKLGFGNLNKVRLWNSRSSPLCNSSQQR